MKVEIGKKYRVIDERGHGFDVGDIVALEQDNSPSDIHFFKRVSDGLVSWVDKKRLAPHTDDDKKAAMKIEVGKKYRVIKDNGQHRNGDVVLIVKNDNTAQPWFIKKISDGWHTWYTQEEAEEHLAPYAEDEYPLTLSQAIEAMDRGERLEHLGSGGYVEYALKDGVYTKIEYRNDGHATFFSSATFSKTDRFRIAPAEPVTTTELVGMFGSYKVEVTRKDGKLVRDTYFNRYIKEAKKLITIKAQYDIPHYTANDGSHHVHVICVPDKVQVGCQTVPFADALALAQKFIKIAEGE